MLDLTKAFNSVDRGLAWQTLLHRGAPAKPSGPHQGLAHWALCTVDSPAVGTDLDAGFKQRCVLTPDLFSLYLDTAVQALLPVLSSLGGKISYSLDGQLTECKIPTRSELVWMTSVS